MGKSSNNNQIKIVTINARTLSSRLKQEEILHEIEINKQQITLIQESRIPGFGIESRGQYTLIHSGQKVHKHNGVAIILSPDVQLIDADTENSNDRLLAVKVIVKGLRLQLISGYAPTNEAKDSAKDTFYRQLQKIVNLCDKEYKLILGADMNATIAQSSFGFWRCLGKNNYDRATNDNVMRLLKFADENHPILENTKRLSKRIHTNTWSKNSSTGIFEKRIDYFAIPKFIRNFCVGCRVYRGKSASYDTDHKMIQMTLQVPKNRRHFLAAIGGGRRKAAEPKLDLKVLKEPEINKKYCDLLDSEMGKEGRN